MNDLFNTLQNELLKHGELYDELYSCILTELRSFESSIDDFDLAENILKRIIENS